MEMHQVRYFLAVARTLNFTRAAEECNVTQPSLTRAVQKLEEELGGLLFRRERSLTHLTDLGRAMLPYLETTFAAAQSAKDVARGIGKAQVAPLTLGVAHAAMSEGLQSVLDDLATSLPGLQLSVSSGASGAILEQALRGDLDLMIVEVPADVPERLESWDLYRQHYYFVSRRSHALAQQDAVALADLTEEQWIDCGGDGIVRLRQAAERLGVQPSIRHRAAAPSQVQPLVLAGLGSAVLPKPESDDERLVALALIEEEFVAPVVLAGIAGRRRSMAAEAFVRAARARRWADR